jgi:hypothetical protein
MLLRIISEIRGILFHILKVFFKDGVIFSAAGKYLPAFENIFQIEGSTVLQLEYILQDMENLLIRLRNIFTLS